MTLKNSFFSNMGQQKEHTLEESICKPLIGQQIGKPFFYYCKKDPTVEYLHLEIIEDHIRLKDPERHKSKLLELLREDIRESEELSICIRHFNAVNKFLNIWA
jgi:hypothetical protein